MQGMIAVSITQVATFAPAELTNPAGVEDLSIFHRAAGCYFFNRSQLGLFIRNLGYGIK